MRPVYIRHLASELPLEPVNNEQMEQVLGQIGDRPSRARRVILRSNGIRNRHYVLDPETREPTQTNAQLTAAAIRGLVDQGLALDQLEVLACGTSSPDQLMPGHAAMVHGELRQSTCEAVSFAGICASGIAAMKYAVMAVRGGDAERAVATGSEVASTFMRAENFVTESAGDPALLEKRPELAFDRDFLRWMLSDGAGAAWVSSESAPGALRVEWIEQRSYAHEQPACMYAGADARADGGLQGWREYGSTQTAARSCAFSVKQNVRQLNEFITYYTVERALGEIAAKRGLRAEDVDWFVPHYSSAYFRSRCHESMQRVNFDVPQERWFTNLADVGNVGSASMYLMLDALQRSGRLQPGQKILCFVPESGRFTAAYMLLTAMGTE